MVLFGVLFGFALYLLAATRVSGASVCAKIYAHDFHQNLATKMAGPTLLLGRRGGRQGSRLGSNGCAR